MEAKAPGGKLVRLRLWRNGVRRVTLSGDFFIYPEDGIIRIEEALSGLRGDEALKDIEAALNAAVEKYAIRLVGLDVPLIALLFKGAADVEDPGP